MGRPPCPSLVIMDGAVGEEDGARRHRGFDGHKLVQGRKRHILVDTLGLPIASRVEPANVPDQKAGARLLGGLRALLPAIRTVMAEAGHDSRKLARHMLLIACVGVTAGAWWKMTEWGFDQLKPGNMIKGKYNTVFDLIMDSRGAALAAWLSLKVLRPAPGLDNV